MFGGPRVDRAYGYDHDVFIHLQSQDPQGCHEEQNYEPVINFWVVWYYVLVQYWYWNHNEL